MISTGILLAIVSMVFWGISDVTIKLLTRRFSALSVSVYKFIPHIIMVGIFFALSGFFIPKGGRTWLLLLCFGIIGGVGIWFFVKAIGTGMVSVNVAIAHAYIIITAILSAIFLHEILGWLQYVSIAIILFGLFFLTFDMKEFREIKFWSLAKGAKYALVTAVLWGVIFLLMKMIVMDIGPYASSFYPDLMVLFFIGTCYLSRKPGVAELQNKVFKGRMMTLIIFSAIASVVATIAMMFSLSMEKVAITMGIVAAAPFITYILAHIFLKERVNKIQLFAIITITAGIVLLSYLSG